MVLALRNLGIADDYVQASDKARNFTFVVEKKIESDKIQKIDLRKCYEPLEIVK